MKKRNHSTLKTDNLAARFADLSSAIILVVVWILAGCSAPETQTNQMQIDKKVFGQLEDGTEAHLFTLTNPNGVEVQITNYGGIIVSLKTPDRHGEAGNIVLGFDNLEDYLAEHPYFGALIGRYGNRIENGRFELDGVEYQLSINDGQNHLHGGIRGFDKVLWDAEVVNDSSLRLKYLSRDGEEGYPGNLDVTVTYTLAENNELRIDYEAETDQATPVNLTAHSYFNLSGDPAGTILDHEMQIEAGHYTPVNEQLIPTGEIAVVEGTPFDFRNAETVGSRIGEVPGGYDHNYVLANGSGELAIAAVVFDPESGRRLSVYTTEPGIQFYSGNFLDGSLTAPNGASMQQYAGLCLEPQHFPNSPNEPSFPSTILRPDERYESTTVYSFSVD